MLINEPISSARHHLHLSRLLCAARDAFPPVFEATPYNFIKTRGFKHYPKLIIEYRGFPPPEERLYSVMIGGIALVLGTFWLGRTGQYANINWIVPATVLIGHHNKRLGTQA
uniref:Acyl-CoA ligase AFT1-1 ) n=1 Tax=Ganoderma boninense TaxID=34458 RepID=A0A5K1JW94_9APHY|nr:Acyl-CoA ligase AFT1-1 (EC (AF-toxin biosynthesis protein 1-1) [Ganoderma boninense]